MQNKEYSKLTGRLARWSKAQENAYTVSFENDADSLVDALENLDRKEELLIRSLISTEDYRKIKQQTQNTRAKCLNNFAVKYTEDTES